MTYSFTKSPLNYTGGKHKLLPQLYPFFPNEVNTFVDLFTGGGNVAVNVHAKNIVAYDCNQPVIDLYTYMQVHTEQQIDKTLQELIRYYQLSDTYTNGYATYGCDSSKGLGRYNKERYTNMRHDYNTNKSNFPKEMLFFALILFGFNNQIRFNRKGEFNMPVGKRDFNRNVRKNLTNFLHALHTKPITFQKQDFRSLNVQVLKEGDFVYADPPYLLTTAVYNEQNGWTEQDERDLLHLLDTLHQKGVCFALSNVLQTGETTHPLLERWSNDYFIHTFDFNYKNANYQKKEKEGKEVEVLITNYHV